MRIGYLRDSDKGLSLEFPEGYRVRQKATEEGWKVQQLKCCELAMFRE